MKKFLAAAVAASVIAVPATAAPFDHNRHGANRAQTVKIVQKRNGRQVVKVKQANRRKWARGQRFDRRYARNYRVINNYRNYRLQAPPRGYRWVQSDHDAVLVAITSGIIGAVIGNRF